MLARDRLAFPLDVPTLVEARAWIERLRDTVGVFKVGLELFTRAGPPAVDAVLSADARCFLDLKLHDIPKTMAGAVSSASALGVHYLTVHASAGPAAMAAVAETAHSTQTELLAVTLLTSLDAADTDAIGWKLPPQGAAPHLARLAFESGIRGFVCSPHECASLRSIVGAGATLATPGIRLADSGAAVDDQRRVATPATALAAGSDLLVVGRPIRLADDPVAAARSIIDAITSSSSE